MNSPGHRPVAISIVGVAVAFVLAACAPPPPHIAVNNANKMVQEYRDEAAKFPEPLPGGRKFPKDPPGDYSTDQKYEAGFGGSFAAMYWRCQWMGAYLDAFNAHDEASENTALDELSKWRSIPWVAAHVVDDPDNPFQSTIVDTARLGDPTALRNFYQSC